MRSSHRKDKQHGSNTVEFAVSAIVFFGMLLGAIEFARLIYVWNTVQEVSRNAARQLVVTDFNDAVAIARIKRTAMFLPPDGTDVDLPVAAEISTADLQVRYLNAAGTVPVTMPLDPGDNIAACMDPLRIDSCIRFVEVCLTTGSTCQPPPDQILAQSVSFAPMFGLFSQDCPDCTNLSDLKIPFSTVRMPVESLGYSP